MDQAGLERNGLNEHPHVLTEMADDPGQTGQKIDAIVIEVEPPRGRAWEELREIFGRQRLEVERKILL